MKHSVIFRCALVGLTCFGVQHVKAGSAVALADPGHIISEYGHPEAASIDSALAFARQRYGMHVRIIASSDVTGYGAIAVALHPNGHGTLIGVALGQPSATQADALAVAKCVKAGGTHARVRWGFRG
jgi:hypothetical protein